ncbi:hypothetical protein [Stutzerimonas nitrititolerans]|uniref:hypothetical protein n=1 Tax=Stutzerimonas nitrititolerans TaxID=2482751 RepID=UPI0028B108D7|nr:hypothetical protein [Stutzerimonas nitrititolerans]
MPDHYLVIPNENAGDRLAGAMGAFAAVYDGYLFTLMKGRVGEQYQHGLWELRQYHNGALALVLPSQDMVTVEGCNEQMSLEAVSLFLNIKLLSRLCEVAFSKGDEVANERFHDLAHALRDAVSGLMNFILHDQGISEPGEEHLALPMRGHPESQLIYQLLD